MNKSGAWYAYHNEKIGQGRENAKNFLKEHPDICEEIEKQVRIHYHLLPDEEPLGEAETEAVKGQNSDEELSE